ncbi:fumarate hydratase [Christensenellaceae bacterium OttesenSCG-928-K19]|nr:fumarate hydratase [Christensenellaceae bacterium OttesenSCG-928-K19]
MDSNGIKKIWAQEITDTVRELFLCACIAPDVQVMQAVEDASQVEKTPHAREVLRQLVQNSEIALNESIPACQDTGMAVVMLEVGQDVHIAGGYVEEAVNEGVRQAYEQGYFRKSVLDPLSRQNTKDNTPAVIHMHIVPGNQLKITALPKGFGSENMSQLKMLKPSDGEQGVADFIVETTKQAGGSPCPPVILGVGIGGTFESCAMLAKKQLLRQLGSTNPDAGLAKMEQEVLDRINAAGMGPMGMGGDTYCLGVHIAKQPTHIAALPVAVNFCCHMLRHASAVL